MTQNEQLMKKALNDRFSSKERANAFDSIYNNYLKMNKNDFNWDKERIALRKKFAQGLNNNEKKKFGLIDSKIRKAFFKLLKNKQKGNSYPTEFFYQISYPIIHSLLNKKDSILEIGYGEFPALQRILEKDNINYFGIEPYPKKINNKKLFKGNLSKLPRKLNQRYNLVLANMVYTINYTNSYPRYFDWELKNKNKLLKTIHNLIKPTGYFISIDDIGTIFSKKELEKYFSILIFEKDIEIRDFNNKGAIVDFGRVTILQRLK
jgi:hypothetical protein